MPQNAFTEYLSELAFIRSEKICQYKEYMNSKHSDSSYKLYWDKHVANCEETIIKCANALISLAQTT